MPIRIYGDPILRANSEPVEKVDDEILSFALDMLETMHHEEGIGLAAVQVGRPIRLLVADIGDRAPKGASKIFINPEILDAKGEWIFDEGCLSVPGATAEILRKETIRLRYTDGKGREQEDTFNQLHARVLLHEIDHLNGKLFIDYLGPMHRAMVMRKLNSMRNGQLDRGPRL
jgi:peptide deformylase